MSEKRGYDLKKENQEFLEKSNKDNIKIKIEKKYHVEGIKELNNILKGEATGLKTSYKGNGRFCGYIPDIIKENVEYEYEYFGDDRFIKFVNKWKSKRFDNNISEKKILIIGINQDLIKLFDEVYVFNKGNLKKWE